MHKLIPLAVLAASLAGAAQAHVSLQPAAVPQDSDQTLRVLVGHGCNGQPTTSLRLELPPEVTAVAPQDKAGWTVTVARGAGPTIVTWSGGQIGAHAPGEFQLKAHLPARPGPLVLTAVQSCGDLTERWDQPAAAPGQPKPDHPAPTLLLLRPGEAPPAPPAAKAAGPLPKEVQLLNGALADAAGRPLYTFDGDNMVGMSHCNGACQDLWPPLKAPADAKVMGDWSPIWRDDGRVQWTYRTKPLYTYAKDQPGQPPAGADIPNWRLAK